MILKWILFYRFKKIVNVLSLFYITIFTTKTTPVEEKNNNQSIYKNMFIIIIGSQLLCTKVKIKQFYKNWLKNDAYLIVNHLKWKFKMPFKKVKRVE